MTGGARSAKSREQTMTRPRKTAELSLVGDAQADASEAPEAEVLTEAPAAPEIAKPEAAEAKDVRALALKHGPEAIAALVKIINEGSSEASKIAAANALLDRAYGKARQGAAPVEPPEETKLTVMFV
jgi:hypothetical protein